MTANRPLFISFSAPLASYVGQAFGIALLNLITLGLYKPYGLTKVRRALYTQINVGKDALDYTGDGESLGRVTFYPSLALLFLLIVPALVQFLVSFEASIVIGVAQLFMLAAFYHYLAFKQKQYELSQVSFRGEAFTLVGSAQGAMGQAFGLQVLSLFTLGLTQPWQRVAEARRYYDNLYYGRQKISCTLSVSKLLLPYIIGWVGALAGLIAALVYLKFNAYDPVMNIINGGQADPAMAAQLNGMSFDMGGGGMAGAPDPEALAEVGTFLNALFLTFTVYPVWVIWRQACLCVYEAAFWRELCAATRMGEAYLRFEGGPLGLLILSAGSFFANFMSANLARPFTTYARIHYFTRHLLLQGLH